MIKQRGNLHALWDQLLGDNFTLNGTNKRMQEIWADDELVSHGIERGKSADQQVWLKESRSLASTIVYGPEVMSRISLVRRDLAAKPEVIELSEDYLKEAGELAKRRAFLAAQRLAAEWRSIN